MYTSRIEIGKVGKGLCISKDYRAREQPSHVLYLLPVPKAPCHNLIIPLPVWLFTDFAGAGQHINFKSEIPSKESHRSRQKGIVGPVIL